MRNLNFIDSYNKWSEKMKSEHLDQDKAMKEAIGSEFDSMGLIEKDILIMAGMKEERSIVDVGCGSGRLAIPLSYYLTSGKYLGIDVVPDFIEYAKSKVAHPNFKFEVTQGFQIPKENESTDMVCFFSVFTHLLHEESYNYLKGAKRILKPEGKIVFSFLEFYIYSHWNVFENNVNQLGQERHLDMFMSRDAIQSWAHHLGLNIEAIYDGDKPNVQLNQPIIRDDGSINEKQTNLGQSFCILTEN